jgi:hypothetical protein
MDNEREEAQHEELPYFTEGIQLCFESVKQLTTLNAGSIVIIGTFLKDIFPNPKGALDVSRTTEWLITGAFICFGLSLALSAILMHIYSRSLEDVGGYIYWHRLDPEGRTAQDYGRLMERGRTTTFFGGVVPMAIFTVGVLCFGAAVVLNLWR